MVIQFQCHATPDDSEQHKKVPPMVCVNNVADDCVAEKNNQSARKKRRPWPITEDKPKPGTQRQTDEDYIGGKSKPGVIMHCFQPDIVNVFAVVIRELDDPDAERVGDREIKTNSVAGKSTGIRSVIALNQLRALAEH